MFDAAPPGSFQISLKVFLRRDAHFLVLRDRISQVGDLPGGRLSTPEFYGDWVESVRRELREELGPALRYTLYPEPLFLFPHRMVSAQTDGLGIAYLADYRGGALQLSDEHDAASWEPIAAYDPTGFFTDDMARAVRHFQELAQTDGTLPSLPCV